jgi:hypothetical protein
VNSEEGKGKREEGRGKREEVLKRYDCREWAGRTLRLANELVKGKGAM